MRSLRAWMLRLLNVFRSARSERELSAEIDSHLQLHIDDNLRAMWKQAQEEAEVAQEDLSPEEFARDVVDELFSDLGN